VRRRVPALPARRAGPRAAAAGAGRARAVGAGGDAAGGWRRWRLSRGERLGAAAVVSLPSGPLSRTLARGPAASRVARRPPFQGLGVVRGEAGASVGRKVRNGGPLGRPGEPAWPRSPGGSSRGSAGAAGGQSRRRAVRSPLRAFAEGLCCPRAEGGRRCQDAPRRCAPVSRALQGRAGR